MDEQKLSYHRQYNINRYHRIFRELIEEHGGKCVSCGSLNDLQFDHVDPSTKLFNVSTGITTKKMVLVREEAMKCQLLCQDCHSRKSVSDAGMVPSGTHGTLAMYSHKKCRCDDCRSAWNKHSREYRNRRRQHSSVV